MKTSAFLKKTKVVELEILYNSSVNGAPDQLLNDGLCPKYFLCVYLYFGLYLYSFILCGIWHPVRNPESGIQSGPVWPGPENSYKNVKHI